MKAITVFIPGQFEDAFLYMGTVIAVTARRSLKAFSLSALARMVNDAVPRLLPIADFLFLRNDWLASSVFKAMMKNEGVRTSFEEAIDRFPEPFMELQPDALESTEFDIKIEGEYFLDLTIYNRRLYLASTTGLYHWDLVWEEDAIEPQGDPRERLEEKCTSLLTGYGAINASCGNAGLFMGFDEFGWSPTMQEPNGLRRVQEQSVRTAWLGFDLVNYATSSSLVLLHTETEVAPGAERRGMEDYGRRVCTAVSEEDSAPDAVVGGVLEEMGVDTESVQYLYNTNNAFFVNTFAGEFFVFGFRRSEDGVPEITYRRKYKSHGGRILTASMTKLGLVAETDERVVLFHQGGWQLLVNTPAISVRSFARSRRYQNLVVVVADEGLYLVGVYD